ncbi:helix-turn-helix domain-containing protein [Magnetovibrio blakemorei]|nr:helix-turn-helix domain-containing protein [Magnetovibrio blakemorei]
MIGWACACSPQRQKMTIDQGGIKVSLDATLWAWNQKGLTPEEKTVLLSLADRAGEEHTAWPSAKRIARDTELSDRHVRSVIEQLVFKKKIRPVGSHFSGVKIYQLIGVLGRENEVVPTTDKMSGVNDNRLGEANIKSSKPLLEISRKSNTRLTPPTVLLTRSCLDEARQRFPGYDIDNLKVAWQELSAKNQVIPKDPCKCFLAWVKSYVEKRRLPYGGEL